MSSYAWLLWAHIVSSTVLFGTGAGIAFFFIRAQRTGDVRVIAAVARDVVLADLLFTATAVVFQPLSGFALARIAGFSLATPWIVLSLALYVLVGCCWLPVVALQIKMRDLAHRAIVSQQSLPESYYQYYRWWFALGWPAFACVLIIFYMMVAKPALWG